MSKLTEVEAFFFRRAKVGRVPTLEDLVSFCAKRKIQATRKELRSLRYRWKFVSMHTLPRSPNKYVGMSLPRYGLLMLDLANYDPRGETEGGGAGKEEDKRETRSTAAARRKSPRSKKATPSSPYKAFLVGVETLTGQLACVPMRDRTSASWEAAVTTMIEESYGSIRTIVSDRDVAVTSQAFRRGILKEYSISWIFLRARPSKAYRSERMISFLKRRLSVAMAANPDVNDWSVFVRGIVDEYNARKIRGTTIKRSSVGKDNYMDLLEELYRSEEPSLLLNIASGANFTPATRRKLWRYSVGDRVLLRRELDYHIKKSAFDKPTVLGSYAPRTRLVQRLLLKSNANLFLTPVYGLSRIKEYFYEKDLVPDDSSRPDASAAANDRAT
jgi:hypothetical protein